MAEEKRNDKERVERELDLQFSPSEIKDEQKRPRIDKERELYGTLEQPRNFSPSEIVDTEQTTSEVEESNPKEPPKKE